MIYIVKYYDYTSSVKMIPLYDLGAFTTWERTIQAIRENLKIDGETSRAVDLNVKDPFDVSEEDEYGWGVPPVEVDYPINGTNGKKWYAITMISLDGE